LVGLLAILSLFVANHENFEFGYEIKVLAGLVCLFFVCMIFHGDLERAKPEKEDLTDFYLQIAVGGVLGAALVAVIAPIVFDSLFEFYMVPVVALYYIVSSQFSMDPWLKWLLRAAVTVSLSTSWIIKERGTKSDVIYRARSFYSTYAVEQTDTAPRARKLIAGTHVHGLQLIDEPYEHMPVAYYHSGTGIANLFDVLAPTDVAMVGLGIGTVVEYTDAMDSVDIYEIDPAVINIAKRYFTVLEDARADIRYIVGDARVNLTRNPSRRYDLIVLDAFSSGSIPTHLITREAMQEILDHLRVHGAIAYHISNRRVDLLPVLKGIADRLDLGILYDDSNDDARLHEYPARWVVLARDRRIITKLSKENFGWKPPSGQEVLWTDEFSNIWSVVVWE